MGDATAVDALRAIVDERADGEHRPQQEELVAAVEQALAAREHALVQAGTGTGKSLGYLIPAVMSGQRVVVSTATKQLSEQLVQTDLPLLAKLLPKITGRDLTYVIIKGRSNYACLAKLDELRPPPEPPPVEEESPPEALALFEVELPPPPPPTKVLLMPAAKTAMDELLDWAQTTSTGDRSEAPESITDLMWREVSTDTAGCPGPQVCSFGSTCFTEKARREAKSVQVVVTNHALVAQDLGNPTPILGEWDAVVFDEAHELVDILSEAWASTVAPEALHATVGIAGRRLSRDDESDDGHLVVDRLLLDLDGLSALLAAQEPGLLVHLSADLREALNAVAAGLDELSTRLDEHPPGGEDAQRLDAAARNAELVRNARTATIALLSDDADRVRWLRRNRRDTGPGELVSAPLWVGPELVRRLKHRTLIATSATLTVAGRFEPVAQSFGLLSPTKDEKGEESEPRAWTGLDVGTPFDFDKQAILYVPDPARFPAPIGRERTEHTAAVLEELTNLVRAAGGRTLALFTTTAGATAAAAHLRQALDTPVLAQGDAPVGQLVQKFAEDEPTTLCGTMGLWHGVDVPGASLSCLVLDKLPFAPMDDPLMAARRSATDDEGRDGFTEVFVANATVKITQGVGRLIRTSTDRGVVAILDTRLRTKGYGRIVLQSLPPMRLMSDLDAVVGALQRLTGTPA